MKTGFLDRVTLCSSCGAPLQAPPDVRAVRCTQCGAENQAIVRVDDAVSEGWSESELARVLRLAEQRRAFDPDPSIAAFVAGMRLSAAAGGQAFGSWQALRGALAPGDVARERPFVELTLLLAWQAAEQAEPHRERGLLETALGLVRMPRHQQLLRASLAVLASRMGDASGAESWLSLADSRSSDLRADSYYRYARAFLHTASGELSRVLGVLGGDDVAVPIVDELAGPCALLRANAWERLGRPGTAVDLLIHHKFEGDPFGQQLTRSFLDIARNLALCPTSEPRAERERLLSLGRRRVQWSKGMVVIFTMALHFLASAAILALLGILALFSPTGGPLVGALLFAFALLIPALLFLAIFWGPYRRTHAQRALLAHGEIAPARIERYTVLGESAARTDFAATVRVVPDRAPPLEVETTIGASPERFAELAAGRPFTVRYRGGGILIEPVLR